MRRARPSQRSYSPQECPPPKALESSRTHLPIFRALRAPTLDKQPRITAQCEGDSLGLFSLRIRVGQQHFAKICIEGQG
jgi:hypothetical protein